MDGIYFDTCLIVKLYLDEPGSQAIRGVAEAAPVIVSSAIAAAEFASALHRHQREGRLNGPAMRAVHAQFAADRDAGLIRLLPLTEAFIARTVLVYQRLPASVVLRAADALHLATAAEAGFREIHSNDARLLAAAPRFKLKGIDPLRK